MGELAVRTYTLAEYLQLEQVENLKYEFHDGLVAAMAGGTPKHGQIQTNTSRVLGNVLIQEHKSCTTYSSDVKIAIEHSRLYFYPDLSVVCGDLQTSTQVSNAIVNPILIIEVLSEGTEAFDRGKKFYYYRKIPSLREYVLISQEEAIVDVYSRTSENIWQLRSYSGMKGELSLHSLDVSIKLAEIYRNVPEIE